MKVRISAAGLSEGAASVIASGGPRREDFARMPENIGAAQHEQSIKGIPATPAIKFGRK